MKKISAFFLVIIMVFSFTACGEKNLGIDCSWDDGCYGSYDYSASTQKDYAGQLNINAKVEKSTITLTWSDDPSKVIRGKIEGTVKDDGNGAYIDLDDGTITWDGDITEFMGVTVGSFEDTSKFACVPDITMIICLKFSGNNDISLNLVYLN